MARSSDSQTSGKAIISLVLGILGLCVPVLLSLPALVLGILSLRDIGNSRGRLSGQGLGITGIVLGGLGTFFCPVVQVALLLPAVQKVREAAGKIESSKNLRQMGIAFHNFHDTNSGFPPAATTDSQGKPLLSWRVLLLPYLEQQVLYSQFKLDEPWDSPNNIRLLDQMPMVYGLPSELKSSKKPTNTYYQVFVGPKTPFGVAGTSSRPFQVGNARVSSSFPRASLSGTFTDGTSNTILVLEAATAVPWTKPEDITYGPNQPLPKLGTHWPSGSQVVLADGSVRTLAATISEATFRAAITANGNEVPGNDW